MNFLKIIITVAIALSFSKNLEAKTDSTNLRVISLIQSIHQKLEKIPNASSLLNFHISPKNPEQGDKITIFLQPTSEYSEQEVLIEGEFLGNPVTLNHFGNDLFVAGIPSQTEIKSYSFKGRLILSDKAQAREIRNSITSLEVEIANLQEQIDQETDPILRDQLIQQRDEKIALKNELIVALEQLKAPIGEEDFTFQVKAKSGTTNLPKIVSITPNIGFYQGGNGIVASGTNLAFEGLTPEVFLGGKPAGINTSNNNTVDFMLPVFTENELGPKDLEIRYTRPDLSVVNAIYENAVFITNQDIGGGEPIPPTAPVAINKVVNGSINLGETAEFSSFGSYDINNDGYSFAWRTISKPQGSLIEIPTNPPGTDPNYSFTPDVPGAYVVELVLADNSSLNLVSEPSLAVVFVAEGVNHQPMLTAPSIGLSTNSAATSQVSLSDQEFWQSHLYLITKQGTLGTASVDANGLVTYNSGATEGSDEIEVTAVDNGNPQAKGSVLITVNILNNNQAPVMDFIYKLQYLDGTPIRTGVGVNSVSDPDGNLKSVKFNFGDGTEEYDPNLDGFVFHEYRSAGNFTLTVTAEDTLGATTVLSDTIAVVQTDIPHPIFHVDTFSGATPLTVNFDASSASDSDGIANYRWRFGDGSPEQIGNFPTIAHTFNNPGVYSVRFRVRDQYGSNGEAFAQVYAGVSAPSTGSKPNAYYVASPSRENILSQSVSFDGGKSFDPNPSGAITNYAWQMNDWLGCPTDGCTYTGQNVNHTFSNPTNYFVGLQVTGALGALSNYHYQEVFAVNQGIMPKAIVTANNLQGVAPFQLQVDSTRSYDFDGTINSVLWSFDDYSACPTDGCFSEMPLDSHNYIDPGVYFLNLSVFDNDDNFYNQSETVTVYPSFKEMAKAVSHKIKVLNDNEENEERVRRKKNLTGACARKNAEACYYLGLMFEEEGDSYTKTKLFERSCSLGYQPACGTFAK